MITMNNLLPTPYQEFIHKSRYARWIEEEGRRENFDETVFRYTNFMANHVKEKLLNETSDDGGPTVKHEDGTNIVKIDFGKTQ